jgi:GTPase SAR1 family protein
VKTLRSKMNVHQVALLGAEGVGKTALVMMLMLQHFVTDVSEHYFNFQKYNTNNFDSMILLLRTHI